MKIYKTMIRPVVMYWSETWTARDENNLRIFERQILRKIFGPVNIDNIWRIRNSVEIDKLICRVIHKSLRDFQTRLRNNQDRHGRKGHINR